MLVQLENLRLASALELHHEGAHPVLGQCPDKQTVWQLPLDFFLGQYILHVPHIHEWLFGCNPCSLFFVGVVLESKVSRKDGKGKYVNILSKVTIAALKLDMIVVCLVLL